MAGHDETHGLACVPIRNFAVSTHRVLQLLLGHLGAALYALRLGAPIKFRLGRPAPRTRARRLAAWTTAQLAVLELVHHAAFDLALTWVRFGHGPFLLKRPDTFQRRGGTERSGARGKSREHPGTPATETG